MTRTKIIIRVRRRRVCVRRAPVRPAVPAVQPAAAQALRPVPEEVPVHGGLSAGPVLPGGWEERVPAAQGVGAAARRPAVRRRGGQQVRAAVVQGVDAAARGPHVGGRGVRPPTSVRSTGRLIAEGTPPCSERDRTTIRS